MITRVWKNTSLPVRFLFFIYLLTLPLLQPWVNSDGIAYYSQLRSLIIDHDLQFENEFRYYQTQFRGMGKSSFLDNLKGISNYSPAYDEEGLFSPDEPKTITNHTPNRTSFGPALLWLPFFLLGHCIAFLAQILGMGNYADGYSLFYVLPIAFGTTVYGFLGLLLSYRIANTFVSKSFAIYSTLAIWFASPLLYYMYLVPSMAHTLSVFCVALFLYSWFSWRKEFNSFRILVLGILIGIMSLVRWQNAIFLLIPTVDIFIHKQTKIIPLILFLLLSFLFGFIPQMIIWKIVYGSFLLIPMGNETMNWFQPKLYSVLFSSRHGLLTWSPIFIFSLIGLFLFYRKETKITLMLILVFVLQIYINGVPTNWWCGSSFGYRRLLDLLPIFILGLAVFLEIIKNYLPIKAVYSFFVILVIWNIGFMIQFAFGMISHTQPVSIMDIAGNQITQVPEKIITILRYLLFRH